MKKGKKEQNTKKKKKKLETTQKIRDKKTPSVKKRKREVISVTDGTFELKFCDFYFSYIGDIF